MEAAALGLRVDGVKGIDDASKSLDRLSGSAESAEKASGGLSTESRKTTKSLADVSRESDRSSASVSRLAGAAKLAAGVFAGFKLTTFIADITLANSRFEQLGTVMGVVGRTADLSTDQVNRYAAEVEAMGISMTESRQTVIRMIQAQLDLSKASELARLAQDAAVIANTNSSDALGRLINGLQTGQVETLRTMGINVNFAQSYTDLAKQLGVSTDQLTEAERAQARMNVVMEAGTGIAGAYDASMDSAGKQLGSTTRYLQDLGVVWGEVFSDAGKQLIFGYSDALKALHASSKELRDDGTLAAWSENLADATALLAIAIGARLTSSLYASVAAFAAAQVQAIRYQAALASMAGVSTTAAIRLTALSAAARGATAAMAFLGGPVGVALIAAGSLYYFRDSLFSARSEASEAVKEIDELSESFKDLTDSQIENERNSIAARMRENVVAIAEARDELALLRDEQNKAAGGNSFLPGGVSGVLSTSGASAEIQELVLQNEALARALEELDNREEVISSKREERQERQAKAAADSIQRITDSLAAELYQLENGDRAWLARRLQIEGATPALIASTLATYDAVEAIKQQRKETDELEGAVSGLLDSIDPLREFARTWEIVQRGIAAGLIDEGQAERLMDGLVEAGEDAAAEFENQWQSTADSVAQSLQDAIASGDWDKLGDSIGNALAASISGVVNKTITDSLAKDLTANSSTLAQIGGAFAGPIAGAVAGGAIQLAISELSDFFSLGDWDPTAARQAAQGTGTVLGSIDAKSESIAKATDLAANASRELVGINRDMLRALETLQLGIGGASARVAQGRSGISLPGVSVDENFFSNFGIAGDVFTGYFDTIGSFLSFGLLDGLGSTIGKALGGKSRQVDEGVQIIGGYISDLVDETVVNAYATFRVKKNVFSSTKTKEQFQRIGGDVEQQFSLVFESLLDSVIAGADVLGVDAAAALAGFRVSTQRLSLEGLSAEQQTAELEAYFGTVFDQLAGAAIPFLDDFQKAGEGLGETLARVATQVQVTQEAVNMLGLRFSDLSGAALIEASDRLIELNGGLDQFISSMQNFIGNFATESQQFQINANALASGLGDLPLPQTRDGFWQLVQAQDAATQAGAENIATLLRLQGTADAYYSAVEKAQEDYYQTEIQGQQQRLSEAQSANRAVQSAIDGMLYQSSAVQEASRQSALRTLDQIARAGRVNNLGQLQGALDAATQLDTGRFGSFADYAREYARTAGVIGRVGDVTQQAESREARMLKNLESQLEAVKGLRKDLEISQLEIVKQTKKTARILERISLGENEALV